MEKHKIITNEEQIIKNKGLFNQIINSEKNIKKGKIKELKY